MIGVILRMVLFVEVGSCFIGQFGEWNLVLALASECGRNAIDGVVIIAACWTIP